MRSARRQAVLGLLVVPAAALAIAGCGGSSKPLAQQTPQQVVSTAAAALDQVHSFHMDGSGQVSGAPMKLSADVAIPGRMSLTMQRGAGTAQIIVLGRSGYLKANSRFWNSNGGAGAAGLLADRWLVEPKGALGGFGSPLTFTSSSTVGHCALESHLGNLASGGTTTFDGQRAVVVIDKGGVPGSTPGKLYVAATGKPLPIAIEQTGAQLPGGRPDKACDETASDLGGGNQGHTVITFSRYDAPVSITAPKGAVTINSLLGQAQG